ncbi:hypothetical protein FKW77_002701 [Venturia effusa]|uniref:Uncharacterized protein n=1 Tax=Venturia effusa TaxID=50376 RepID=A0A517L514_9PEZI|nr:hypothetical protein FKW77_002701 [Venturia effusa]
MSDNTAPPMVVHPHPVSSTEFISQPPGTTNEQIESDGKQEKQDGKLRSMFGLLKRKGKGDVTSESLSSDKAASVTSAPKATPVPDISGTKTPPRETSRLPGSPPSNATSPSHRIRSASPGLHSPASSLIFERNVQEEPVPDEYSQKIPHHIHTEDRIPAVLEASSIAITDDHLNPDEVEIVSLQAHQPAEATVPGHPETASGTLSPTSLYDESALSTSTSHEPEPAAPNYGSHDAADIRRLSFISFADVVQSEHVDYNKEMQMSFASTANRSPSPVRSPASSHGLGPSPPASGATSIKGFDIASRLPGSPTSHATHSPPATGGELMVETLRQALRKTASRDLSDARRPSSPSQALSASSLEDDQPSFHRPQ